MMLSALLDTAIGLFLVYFVMGTLCSGLNEWIAQGGGRRGRFLREGLVNLIGDRAIYLQLITHPLVAAYYRDTPGKPRHPSYLPSEVVARALMEVVTAKAGRLDPDAANPGAGSGLEQLRRAVDVCAARGYQAAAALKPLLDSAVPDVDAARHNIQRWFDAGMERVSGWYKRAARRWLASIGIALSLLLNVDSIEIAQRLWHSAPLRSQIVATAVEVTGGPAPAAAPQPPGAADLVRTMQSLEQQGLPIGFSCLDTQAADRGIGAVASDCWRDLAERSGAGWIMKVLGCVLTGLLAALGAPFWFDLLTRAIARRVPAAAK